MKLVLSFLLIFLITGCSYSVKSNAFPHLKTIIIEEFSNKTLEYGMEEDISTQLTNEFFNDGRLSVVTMNSDALLEGTIRDYSNKIYSYDENGVEEYQVKMMFHITFTDLVRNQVIWTNEKLILSEKYSSVNDLIEAKTEEEAKDIIIEELFDTILKNTLEEW